MHAAVSSTGLSADRLVNEAMSVLGDGEYFAEGRGWDFVPTPPVSLDLTIDGAARPAQESDTSSRPYSPATSTRADTHVATTTTPHHTTITRPVTNVQQTVAAASHETRYSARESHDLRRATQASRSQTPAEPLSTERLHHIVPHVSARHPAPVPVAVAPEPEDVVLTSTTALTGHNVRQRTDALGTAACIAAAPPPGMTAPPVGVPDPEYPTLSSPAVSSDLHPDVIERCMAHCDEMGGLLLGQGQGAIHPATRSSQHPLFGDIERLWGEFRKLQLAQQPPLAERDGYRTKGSNTSDINMPDTGMRTPPGSDCGSSL